MLNELKELSDALEKNGISTEPISSNYLELPKVTKKAPCIRILVGNDQRIQLESISAEQAETVRKFGNNQGSFPALNLCPLFRIEPGETATWIAGLEQKKITSENVEKLKQLCTQKNWDDNTFRKIRNSLGKQAGKIQDILQTLHQENPIQILIKETECFQNPLILFDGLEKAAFSLLEKGINQSLALKVLFYFKKDEKDTGQGTLSVVFDSLKLILQGKPVVSQQFTASLNSALVDYELREGTETSQETVDAFGNPYVETDQPLPEVKLKAGFTVTLRTMFKDQYCQKRYGKIGRRSYPIAETEQKKMQSALLWISRAEQKNITWTKTAPQEVLFVFCAQSPVKYDKLLPSLQKLYTPEMQEKTFKDASSKFIASIKIKDKKERNLQHSDSLRFFVLRKLDKGRSKIVYTYNTSPEKIIEARNEWLKGCRNLPNIQFNKDKNDIYPLEVTGYMNAFWNQSGNKIDKDFRAYPGYYGIKVFFGNDKTIIRQDLSFLITKLQRIAQVLGNLLVKQAQNKFAEEWKGSLILLGLYLYKLHCQKEEYMTSYPYFLGQMLKVSDLLHAFYCDVVRQGSMPAQFVGSSLYLSAAEMPGQALMMLSQRMQPYIAWAKTYALRQNEDSWKANWLLSLYEKIAAGLWKQWQRETRFNDEERAELFIGYLAGLPVKEKQMQEKRTDEVQESKEENHGC